MADDTLLFWDIQREEKIATTDFLPLPRIGDNIVFDYEFYEVKQVVFPCAEHGFVIMVVSKGTHEPDAAAWLKFIERKENRIV